MLALFKKEILQREGIPQGKSVTHYVFVTLGIMLLASIVEALVLFPFIDSSNVEASLINSKINCLNLYLTSITIFMILAMSKYHYHRTIESLGCSKKNRLNHYLQGLLLGFLMISGALLIVLLFGGATFKGFDGTQPLWLIVYFGGFMIQGFEEELLCRGFMMYGLSKSKSVFFSVMANSIFFAMLHLGNPGMTVLAWINLILAGVVFSCLALTSDDIWVASGAHSMWNFAQGNLYGILVSGITMGPSLFKFELTHPLAGGSFGLEGGIGVLIIEILSIIILVINDQKKHK